MTHLSTKEHKRLQSREATKVKQRLRKQADALWQQCVKLEHPGCEVCGKVTQVGHHFFTKGSSSALRYELQNGIGLCNGCHFKVHRGEPTVFYAMRRAHTRDAWWYNDLFLRRTTIAKRSKAYYEGEIERLTGRLEELEGT